MKRIAYQLALPFVLLCSVGHASLNLLDFQVNAIDVVPTAGTGSFSGQVAWTPLLELGGFGIRGEIGAGLLKNQAGSSFVTVNYEGFLRIPILPFFGIEGGGGVETWNGNGGTNPIASGNLLFKPWGIDRLFVGYSRYFLPGNAANEFRVGIGFNL